MVDMLLNWGRRGSSKRPPAALILFDQAFAENVRDRLGAVAGTKFLQNVPQVRLHRARGEDDPGGDFPIRASTRQLEQDVKLSGCETLKLQPQAVPLLPRHLSESFHELPGYLRGEEGPPVADGPDSRGETGNRDILQYVAGCAGLNRLKRSSIAEAVGHDDDLNAGHALFDHARCQQAVARHILIHQNHVGMRLAGETDDVIGGLHFANNLHVSVVAQQGTEALPNKFEVGRNKNSNWFGHRLAG